MKISEEAARELLPIVRKAVAAKIACWEAQGDIEMYLGTYFRNMESTLGEMALGEPEDLTLEDVIAYLEDLEEEK